MMLLSTCLPQVSFVLQEDRWLRASFCGFASTCRFACYGERLFLVPRDCPQPSLIHSGLHPGDPMQGFLQNITALLVLTEESKPVPAMALPPLSYWVTVPLGAVPHNCRGISFCDENGRVYHSRGSSMLNPCFADCCWWLTIVCRKGVGTSLSFTFKLFMFNISFSIFVIRWGD